MKNIITKLFITILIFCFSTNLNAQEVRSPLKPSSKATNVIPVAPSENVTWVKGHWEWDRVKYKWKEGEYIENKEGYVWQDGEWERNTKSGWWRYEEGYWIKESELSSVKNDKNTSTEEKVSKDARNDNKSNGMFIKTSKD